MREQIPWGMCEFLSIYQMSVDVSLRLPSVRVCPAGAMSAAFNPSPLTSSLLTDLHPSGTMAPVIGATASLRFLVTCVTQCDRRVRICAIRRMVVRTSNRRGNQNFVCYWLSSFFLYHMCTHSSTGVSPDFSWLNSADHYVFRKRRFILLSSIHAPHLYIYLEFAA